MHNKKVVLLVWEIELEIELELRWNSFHPHPDTPLFIELRSEAIEE
jgi:hypothetical protein